MPNRTVSRPFARLSAALEIVVAGKSSRVSDAIPELNLERLEPIIEPIVERVVKRIVGAPRGLKTIRAFAQANAIGLTLVYEELNAGRLEAIKVGAKTMITPEAEAAWKARLPRYEPNVILVKDLGSASRRRVKPARRAEAATANPA
jgi:hypothetical protein